MKKFFMKNWGVWVSVLVALPACFSFFHSGFFPTHDYIYVARFQQMYEALQNLQFPVRWVSGFRYGEPLFNFYAPLPYYIGALVHYLGFSYLVTAKIVYGLGFVLSSISMYFLTRKFLKEIPSIAIATLYIYAPYRAVDVYVRGAISESLTFIFFPLTILFTLDLLEKFDKKKFAFLVLSLSGLFYTHNILTMLYLPFYVGFVVLMYFFKRQKRFLINIFCALVTAIGVGSSYLIPAFFEKKFVQTQNLTDLYFNYLGHFVAIKQFFITFWGYGASLWGPKDDLSFQIGVIHWFLLFSSIVVFILNLKKLKKNILKYFIPASFLLFIFSLFMQHNRSTFIWQIFKPLAFVQFPWRFLALSVFFVCVIFIVTFKMLDNTKANLLAVIVIISSLIFYLGYFKPDKYYFDSIDDHYVSEVALSRDDRLPKDYLSIWVKVIKKEKIKYPTVLSGKADISNYSLKGTRGKLMVVAEADSKIEIPVTYFPGWNVKVNGRTTPTFAGDEMGLLAFDVPKGKSDVEFYFGNTLIRIVSNLISLISIIFVIFYLRKK